MNSLGDALGGVLGPIESGAGWMGHEAAQAGRGLGRAASFMGGLSHRDNVAMQAEFLAKDLRARGVPEADAWVLAHSVAQSMDVNTPAKQAAAVQVALRQWRTQLHQHGPP